MLSPAKQAAAAASQSCSTSPRARSKSPSPAASRSTPEPAPRSNRSPALSTSTRSNPDRVRPRRGVSVPPGAAPYGGEGRRDCERRAAASASSRSARRSRCLCVYRSEVLDLYVGANEGDQRDGLVDDAARVLVGDRAPAHIGIAFHRGGEIVDQELDLVVVRIVVIHRGRHTVIDAAMRFDAEFFKPQVVLDQFVEAGKGEGDVI